MQQQPGGVTGLSRVLSTNLRSRLNKKARSSRECVKTLPSWSKYPYLLMRVFFMRHIQGEPRQQSTLFPERLDEYVSADNPVRVIDAFIDSLDMIHLGFTQSMTKETGRKPYHPAD